MRLHARTLMNRFATMLRRITLLIYVFVAHEAQAQAPLLMPLPVPHVAQPSHQAQLTPQEKQLWRSVFDNINAKTYEAAATALATLPPEIAESPLAHYAKAELYLGVRRTPHDSAALTQFIEAAPELPQAQALAARARKAGLMITTALPSQQVFQMLGTIPRRAHMGEAQDASCAFISPAVQSLLKHNQSMSAHIYFLVNQDTLSPDCATEMRSRIAWSFLMDGENGIAYYLAEQAHAGSAEWAIYADWTAGLAAWRMGKYHDAQTKFDAVAARAGNPELVGAGHFWAARCAAQRGLSFEYDLRQAAKQQETFYGILAQAALGLPPLAEHENATRRVPLLLQLPNIRAALALEEIGEDARADALIRHQARIGAPADHAALSLIAGQLQLPATQYWLAHYGPAGARAARAAHYPMPRFWQPGKGWRVDKYLVFAHILEESQFQTAVRSRAGAVGLMQIVPSTARAIERKYGKISGALTTPAANLELGQSYLEMLSESNTTQGLLPKVIAAYNAGALPVSTWNAKAQNAADPLLYIETISYWETRAYVTTVLRNYWMYEQLNHEPSPSLNALVNGAWPRFPRLTPIPQSP
jgi:soluble lytic murein transglycosylase